jgi:hypothetical protein
MYIYTRMVTEIDTKMSLKNKAPQSVIFGAYSKSRVFKLHNSTYFIFSKDV